MSKEAEYFRKWSENCRVFMNYDPIHSHEDMMRFAKDYHQHRLEKDMPSDEEMCKEAYRFYPKQKNILGYAGFLNGFEYLKQHLLKTKQ
tara:strand:+ start:283 stop:549 length:267 start_codon:yes stop_codon:yes gene_type:complete